MLDRIAFDRGAHVRGTPLWFDPEVRRELGVVTSLIHRPRVTHKRTVASASVAKVLLSLGYKGSLLPAPEGRWVGVGGQKLEFLHSGWLSCSPALLSVGSARLLFVGALPESSLEWPQAHHLVVGSSLELRAEHKGAPLERVMERLVDLGLKEEQSPRLQICVDTLDVGRAAFCALTSAGVPTHPVGVLAKLLGRRTERVVGKFGVRLAMASEMSATEGRLVRVDTGLERWPHRRRPDITLRLKFFGGADALVDAVERTGAQSISISGSPPFIAAIDARLRKQSGGRGQSISIQRLVNVRQLVLSDA